MAVITISASDKEAEDKIEKLLEKFIEYSISKIDRDIRCSQLDEDMEKEKYKDIDMLRGIEII